MKKVLAFACGVACLAAALPVHAAIIGQQSDTSKKQEFVGTLAGSNGWQGNTFTLPTMTGTLKAFDIYLAVSSFRAGFNWDPNTPTALQITLGGAGCPTSAGTDENAGFFNLSDLGIVPNTTYVNGSEFTGTPVLAHVVLHGGAGFIPTYNGETNCTIQIATSNGLTYVLATDVATGTTDQIAFTGYDTLGTPPSLSSVSLVSSNASSTLAKAGDTVTLTFSVDRDIQTPQVTIAGRAVSAATTTLAGQAGDTFEASTTLTASDAEGPVSFSILATNLLGDDGYLTSTTTDGTAVALDHTAPILAEVAAIGTTTNTTPSYSFSTTEAGTITWGGSCSSATTIATAPTTTVTFNALGSGIYSDCAYTVTDAAGNTSATSSISTFEVSAPTPPPSHGGGDNGPPIANPSQGVPQGIASGQPTVGLEHASPAAVSAVTKAAPPVHTAAPGSATSSEPTSTPAVAPHHEPHSSSMHASKAAPQAASASNTQAADTETLNTLDEVAASASSSAAAAEASAPSVFVLALGGIVGGSVAAGFLFKKGL